MPLICSVPNPYSTDTLATAWAFCSRLELDFNQKVGSIQYSVYSDKTSAYSGKPPLRVLEFAITNTPGDTPGIPTFDELVAANGTAYGLLLAALDALMLEQAVFAGGAADAG